MSSPLVVFQSRNDGNRGKKEGTVSGRWRPCSREERRGNEQTIVLLEIKWALLIAFALSGTLVVGHTQGNPERDSG